MKMFFQSLSKVLLLLLCFNASAQVNPADSLALVSLANSTNINSWNNATNWFSGPVDTWFGITVTSGRVTGINLSSNSLFGTIPADIGALDAVTDFNLSGNPILDPVPAELGDLTALVNLDLSGQVFFRELPAEIGNLVNLEVLNLHDHRLSGDIPFALSNLSNLRVLDLGARSGFEDGLNDGLDLSNLLLLETLDISGNAFEILPDFSVLPLLTTLNIENNLLDFDDVEGVVSQPGITYAPQRISEGDSTVIYLPGQAVLLDATVGGTANVYQWFKDNVALAGETMPTLTIASASSTDEGVYFCEITSPLAPVLTITQRLHYVVENFYNTNPDPVRPAFTFTQLADTTIRWYIMSVNMGDVNNDLIDDLGILLRDRFQIYHGGALQQIPDLEIPVISGNEMVEARSADFNGDGFMDVALSSLNMSDPINTGRVDFYFGSTTPDNIVDHTILATDIKPVAQLGGLRSVNFNSVGDVNNDGTVDFLINLNDDQTYLYFGGSTLSTTPDQVITGYSSDFGIPNLTPFAGDLSNRIYPLGDINGDGIDDFSVSDFFRSFQVAGSSRGVVVVHFGKSAGPITPDLGIALTDPAFADITFLGFTLAAAEVNGDGFNDLVIVAVNARDESVPGENGRELLFVFNGGPTIDNVPDQALKIPAAPFGLDDRLTLPFYTGEMKALPDVSGDGRNELLLTSWNGFTNAVIIESEDLSNNSATPTSVLEAPDPDFFLGVNFNNVFVQNASAVGDFDNDGTPEVLLAQPTKVGVPTEAYLYPLRPLQAVTIITNPQDQMACANDEVTFTVEAAGTALTYQWQESTDGGVSFSSLTNGGVYANVTTDSLTIDPVMLTMDGYQYRCVVSGSATSAVATLAVDRGNYIVPAKSIACSDLEFFVTIEAVAPVSAEVLGLDFCLQYDTAMMMPTGDAVVREVVNGGNAAFSDYSLTIDANAGIINGVIFLTSAAPFPTYFSGAGAVIDIEFEQGTSFVPGAAAEVLLCGVSEATLTNGNIDHCRLTPSVFNSINDPAFIGTLKSWDRDNRVLRYDTANPAAFVVTNIIGVDSSCTPTGSQTFVPDLNGSFIYQNSEGSFVQITRDIPGDFSSAGICVNVMSWINGADQTRALRIATLDPTFTPNAYQLIAADVNQDGVVNAGDVTLIAARSVMSICGFPSAKEEKDWLFIDQTTFDTDPGFQISSTFPASDGVGFSKDRVPEIPACLPAPLDTVGSCVASLQEDYIAILLGDVNGNWRADDGANLREEEPQVVFQIEEMTLEEGVYSIPIVLAQAQVLESFDLAIETDVDRLQVVDVGFLTDDFNHVSNQRKEQFLFSSFTLEPGEITEVVAYLQLTSDGNAPEATDFASLRAFVNGSEVSTGTAKVLSSPDQLLADWKVYPNPFTDVLTLESDQRYQHVTVTMTNFAGQVMYHQQWDQGMQGKVSLNLPDVAKGLYLLTIQTEVGERVIKVIK